MKSNNNYLESNPIAKLIFAFNFALVQFLKKVFDNQAIKAVLKAFSP